MVAAVRQGASLRAVARRFGVSLLTVQCWVERAGRQRLDRVDWQDVSHRPQRIQRTAPEIEDRVLTLRRELDQTSALGEFGARAIHRALLESGAAAVPAVRTIGRILERRGALDGRRRVRRPPPPPGWYLPAVAAPEAELDSFDIVDGLVIAGGTEVEALNAVSLHGGLPAYARLFFFPLRLSADYSPDFLPAVPQLTAPGAAGFVVTAVALAVAVRARHRAPPLTFGVAWMAGTLLIVSNLIVPSEVLLAERTLYLPSVGAAMVFGWLAAWLEASWRRAGVALAALAVGLGMVRTVTRVPVWSDNNRFFPQLIRDAPGSFRASWVAGSLAYEVGDRKRGETLVRRAIVIYPLHWGAWETLAYQLEQDGRWLEAAQHYKAAFTLHSAEAGKGLLAVRNYLRARMADSASAMAQELAASFHDDPRYYAAMAELDSARGRLLAAMTWRRRIAWTFPRLWQSWYLTAGAALAARSCWEAQRSTARLRALRPDLPQLRELEEQLRESRCDR